MPWACRYYFECGSRIGQVRVKYYQKRFTDISEILNRAAQLAEKYEYNDHLASLKLIQGHIAWDEHNLEWNKGFEVALHYYKDALIYALRYNRFLLDEVLFGKPHATTLHPIISSCKEHGDDGEKMLSALHDWWLIGTNDIGVPRHDTISPIPENISLRDAERIAREHEPGDGSPQFTVVEQIERALNQANISLEMKGSGNTEQKYMH